MLRTVIVPRVSETNAARHIGHTVIPVWLEAGFNEILRLFSPNMHLEPNLAIVKLNVDYLKEMFFGKDVEVLTAVKSIGNSSLVLQQEILQDGKLCARGTTTFVHFNYAAQKPEPIPQPARLKLEEHLMTDDQELFAGE